MSEYECLPCRLEGQPRPFRVPASQVGADLAREHLDVDHGLPRQGAMRLTVEPGVGLFGPPAAFDERERRATEF